jgi:hypothetical protein
LKRYGFQWRRDWEHVVNFAVRLEASFGRDEEEETSAKGRRGLSLREADEGTARSAERAQRVVTAAQKVRGALSEPEEKRVRTRRAEGCLHSVGKLLS